jgi:hypothetical protein
VWAALVKIVFAWVGAGTLVGVILAMTVGHDDHGSPVFIVLAWYAALAGAAVHIVIRSLRRRRTSDGC